MATAPIVPAQAPQERFTALAATLLGQPGVTRSSDATRPKRDFGSSALRIDGKIFAMLVSGRLVVKLPRHRVDALIALGEGERFDSGGGRPQKEWLTVDAALAASWLPLAGEALEYVASLA